MRSPRLTGIMAPNFLTFFLLLCDDVRGDVITLDMSYEYEENVTFSWSEEEAFRRTPSEENGQHPNYWYDDYTFSAGEHGGTHIDSPSHFYKDGIALDEIPLEHLLKIPVVKVDISERAAQDSDAELMVDDLEKWESKYGEIPVGSAVFMYTGWGAKYTNRTEFLGIRKDKSLHFPGFHVDAVKWLGVNRTVYGIGGDTASLDYGLSGHLDKYPVHVMTGVYGMWGAELVANMDKLPENGAVVSVLPMKIKGGSGAPSRIFATWDSGASPALTTLSSLAVNLIVIAVRLMV